MATSCRVWPMRRRVTQHAPNSARSDRRWLRIRATHRLNQIAAAPHPRCQRFPRSSSLLLPCHCVSAHRSKPHPIAPASRLLELLACVQGLSLSAHVIAISQTSTRLQLATAHVPRALACASRVREHLGRRHYRQLRVRHEHSAHRRGTKPRSPLDLEVSVTDLIGRRRSVPRGD